ncbi:YbhB/YbcL family Raf kinase inhibitor-like protein [Paraburkholderia gardini]|uniref:YbhB/YbcL family Raf kinase inhibitor-like protein n=1 Tax=Paraburkholderia gardini TaxID=2823469 RepID=A0ABM8U8T5_9BURK|nr:YbhB/YbcL family Raf kinase inhibitor-like protein [Paraburkholderia gardini]CAG4890496.1 hypothetical protein R69919_00950 [Paraburkholderia gardini]CAG4917127.1 hypothetical protein R54767_04373 [Paraburkholderia gardini]
MTRSKPSNSLRRVLRTSMLCAVLALPATSAWANAFELSSPGTMDGATLDSSHAADAQNCGGKNVSPALQWRNAPAGTKSFAVGIFDPDGAKGLGVVHWLMYGMPASTTSLSEGTPPAVSVGGTNRTGHTGYYGPCPPMGEIAHHYIAQVWALDLPPDALPAGLTRDALLAAMKDHVLAATSIVLRYGR